MATCVLVVLAGWRWFAAPGQSQVAVAANPPAQLTPPASLQLAATPKGTLDQSPLGNIALAQYQMPLRADRHAEQTDNRAELRLPTNSSTTWTQLALRPRHSVCAENAARGFCAVVDVPAEGLIVDVPDVQFRNIVFRAARDANATVDALQSSTKPLIRLIAPSVRFDNCLFIADRSRSPRTAILWERGADDFSRFDPVGDRLTLTRCAAAGVQAVVDRRRPGDVRVELTDTLMLDVEMALHLPFPQRGQVGELLLNRVTHRGGGAVLSLGDVPAAHLAGKLLVGADDSLLAPRASSALVELDRPHGNQPPPLVWRGQGSITLPDTTILQIGENTDAEDRDDRDRSDSEYGHAADRAVSLEISGLARASFAFASEELHDPRASAVRRIVGPRRSLSPPGVPEEVLHDFSVWLNEALPPHN
jgi:hypothetical protein